MAKKQIDTTSSIELKGFIKDNEATLLSFCHYLLGGNVRLDDLVLDIFRKFGDEYRSEFGKEGNQWERHELQVKLFALAWKVVQRWSRRLVDGWLPGRDTRLLQRLEADLLAGWTDKHQVENAEVTIRLGMVDMEYRAPVILRDILQFQDEEVLRILGLRWGVYRHRLHRGRLAMVDGLRGTRHEKGLSESR